MQAEQHDYCLKAYEYLLPADLIAQEPASRRDQSRLLVLNTSQDRREHLFFADILRLFRPGDVLVLNNTKVFPARLLGHKESGGKIELLPNALVETSEWGSTLVNSRGDAVFYPDPEI